MASWLNGMSTFHTVGREFMSRPGHTKEHYKNGTNYLPAWHAGMRVKVQPDCIKGRVVSGTVYGDIHYEDLLGSIPREGYLIPFLDFKWINHNHKI